MKSEGLVAQPRRATCQGLGEITTYTREKLDIGFLTQCVKTRTSLTDLASSDAAEGRVAIDGDEASHQVACRRRVAKDLFVDVSQGLSRHLWHTGAVPTVLQNVLVRVGQGVDDR